MDYLKDLLESYTRLKKRTFKIEFINEAGENAIDTKAESELAAILNKAPAVAEGAPADSALTPIQDNKYPGLAAFEYSKTRDGTGVNVKGVAGGGGVFTSKVLDNGAFSTKPGAKRMLEALYAAMRGEEVEKSPEQTTSEVLQQNLEELQNRIGGTFEEVGFEATPKTIENIKKSYEHLNKFKSLLGELPPDADSSLVNLLTKPMAYLAGASTYGLERKLANGRGVEVDEDGKIQSGVTLNPELVEVATESHAVLTEFLTGQGDCDELSKRVGTIGSNKLALFSNDPKQAIIIPPNTLQNVALEKAKKKCGEGSLRDISEVLDTNTKNSVKGTFYEIISRMAVALQNARDQATPEEQLAALKEVGKEFAPLIAEARDGLRAIASERDFGAATDIETYFEQEVLQEQLGIAESDQAIRDFIMAEIRPLLPVTKALRAQRAIDNSKAANTGGREDTFYAYNTQEEAEAAAKRFGVEAYYNRDADAWTIGAGQKRSEKGQKVKSGEFNSEDRRNAVMNEYAQPGSRLEAGFYKMVDDIHGISEDRKEKAIAYGKRLEAKISNLKKMLTQDKTYITGDGKIKRQTAQQNFERLAEALSEFMTPDELADSDIGKAIMRGKKGFADFSDPAVRVRVAEQVMREYRWKQLKKDQGKQHVKDYLVRQTLLTGANARNMLQLVQSDDGRVKVFRHNDVYRKLVKEAKISVSGYGVDFTFGSGKVRLSQEGTTSTPKPTKNNPNPTPRRDTRTTVTFDNGILEDFDIYSEIAPKSTRQDEMFLEFLRGQQVLIEQIIQTRTNQVL